MNTEQPYIDAFAFPIAEEHVVEYQKVAQQVAEIWLEHGALTYQEFVGDELQMPGIRSFNDALNLEEGETVVFGWASFVSKKQRNEANKKVRMDSRMGPLVGPLMDPSRLIFDAKRMVFGGFKHLV